MDSNRSSIEVKEKTNRMRWLKRKPTEVEDDGLKKRNSIEMQFDGENVESGEKRVARVKQSCRWDSSRYRKDIHWPQFARTENREEPDLRECLDACSRLELDRQSDDKNLGRDGIVCTENNRLTADPAPIAKEEQIFCPEDPPSQKGFDSTIEAKFCPVE